MRSVWGGLCQSGATRGRSPGHVNLKLDKANVYNNLRREAIIEALEGIPELAAYALLLVSSILQPASS